MIASPKGDIAMPKSIKVENVTASGGSVIQIGEFHNVTNNLAAQGRADLAQALDAAQQAITASKDIPADKKQEYTDTLAAIGEAATAPKPNKTILKSLTDGLKSAVRSAPDVLKTVAAVADLVTKLNP
jgi:hypothetical protein